MTWRFAGQREERRPRQSNEGQVNHRDVLERRAALVNALNSNAAAVIAAAAWSRHVAKRERRKARQPVLGDIVAPNRLRQPGGEVALGRGGAMQREFVDVNPE